MYLQTHVNLSQRFLQDFLYKKKIFSIYHEVFFYFGWEYFKGTFRFNILSKIITWQVIFVSIISLIEFFLGSIYVEWAQNSEIISPISLLKEYNYFARILFYFCQLQFMHIMLKFLKEILYQF